MHKQLEDYLNEAAKGLLAQPAARREEELSEIRQHLLNVVIVNKELGQSEAEAVQIAVRQFGTPQAVSKQIVSAWRREAWKRGMSTQPELILFGVFSLAITLSQVWLSFAAPKLWQEAVTPYTGWSLSMPYMFSLFFTWWAIFAQDVDLKARIGPITFLLMYAVFGLHDYSWMRHLPDFHNPYLTASPWQPMWTVALPMAWVAVLGICPILRRRKARQPAPLQ